MKKTLLTVLLAILALSNAPARDKRPIEMDRNDENRIQLAILLDASGSMSGLIEQAKAQLWTIVNEMARCKKDGRAPRLEVALYIYGRDDIPAHHGYLRMVVPLSTDLDRISEELFKITTNGGSEYCGKVIQTAVDQLTWSSNSRSLKVIVIAGNEPFTQGDVHYVRACKAAIARGIIVNTIFCGNYQEGVNTQWKHGADLADGNYTNIDHNQVISHIHAPQDDDILRLGKELNTTYLGFGRAGASKKERQSAQDAAAMKMAPSVMVERSIAKSSSQYNNKGWDLVDADEEGSVDVGEMAEEELPRELKGMSSAERREHVKKMKTKREKIQAKINKLNNARRKYVEKERKKNSGANTLDKAIIKAMKKQAKSKDFKF